MIDISLIEFFQNLTNPHLDFLSRAVGISILAAIVCGVVGCYVVLRGMSFIGDAVSHAVFPGLAIAFVFQGSVLLGGAVAGCTVAVLIAYFSQRRTVREDSVIGIFFDAAFALGMVIISRVDGYTASLTSFLFGSLTGVSRANLYTAFTVTVLIVATVLLLGPSSPLRAWTRKPPARWVFLSLPWTLCSPLLCTPAALPHPPQHHTTQRRPCPHEHSLNDTHKLPSPHLDCSRCSSAQLPDAHSRCTPAIAAEQASDTSCDADSLHAFSRGHQDLALVGDSGDLSFIARDDESGKDYASGEFYVEVGSNAAFDESAGSDIPSIGWQIPQTQDPNIPLGGVQHQLPRRGHCCRCHFILDATQRPGRRTHGGLSELRGC